MRSSIHPPRVARALGRLETLLASPSKVAAVSCAVAGESRGRPSTARDPAW